MPTGSDTLPWLGRVARRVLANQRRGNLRRTELSSPLAREWRPDQEVDAGVLSTDEPHGPLGASPPRPVDQEILRLAVWEECRTAQIGLVVGCSETRPGAGCTGPGPLLGKEMRKDSPSWDTKPDQRTPSSTERRLMTTERHRDPLERLRACNPAGPGQFDGTRRGPTWPRPSSSGSWPPRHQCHAPGVVAPPLPAVRPWPRCWGGDGSGGRSGQHVESPPPATPWSPAIRRSPRTSPPSPPPTWDVNLVAIGGQRRRPPGGGLFEDLGRGLLPRHGPRPPRPRASWSWASSACSRRRRDVTCASHLGRPWCPPPCCPRTRPVEFSLRGAHDPFLDL